MEQRKPGFRSGYSLGEMLVALVIGAMVLTAILGVYGRANRAAQAVLAKIDTPVLAAEVLQLVAEDLDRALGADDVTIQIKNGFDNGFVTAQLILRRMVRTIDNREQVLEEIVWRGAYDYDSATPGLVIYRSYAGVGFEDKLLDSKREDLESERPFIPVCRGITFFKIEVPQGDALLDRWADTTLPTGVMVTLSFANPYETVRGTLDVLDHEKTSRTIAVDRTRAIKFTLPPAPDAEGGPKAADEAEAKDEAETTNRTENERTDGRRVRPTRRR